MKRLLIDPQDGMSVREQYQLLALNRASFYYQPKGENPENLEIMRLMDEYILEEPTAGVKSMQYMLRDNGYQPGYERVRRLMRKANIRAIYPRRHLTVLGEKKYVYAYLLRDLDINRPNQVWEVDITYVPMKSGFMYLTAIIDVYSRMILGWGLANTLDAQVSLEVVQQAVQTYGCPEILNSDQGSQFTCKEYVEYLKEEHIKISMDGKGRALDNIYIERFWRTIKYRYIYLFPHEDGIALYRGIVRWMEKYNHRPHQGIDEEKPIVRYGKVA